MKPHELVVASSIRLATYTSLAANGYIQRNFKFASVYIVNRAISSWLGNKVFHIILKNNPQWDQDDLKPTLIKTLIHAVAFIPIIDLSCMIANTFSAVPISYNEAFKSSFLAAGIALLVSNVSALYFELEGIGINIPSSLICEATTPHIKKHKKPADIEMIERKNEIYHKLKTRV